MKHARADYDRIQDPANKIPVDEPVFLLRGQDMNAPATLRFWADNALMNGAHPEIAKLAYDHAALMGKWQAEYGAKIPDVPAEPGEPVSVEVRIARLEGLVKGLISGRTS